ncbi:MAG: DUF2442 domain-containing protein [Rhodocyclaceae bacterium]|nr:DUF2442 domain-containing protein [Rhodocyclaceae bacterium]
MYWDIIDVRPQGNRDIGVRFADGLEGTVTISPAFCTGVFEALRDDSAVMQAMAVDGVMTWPSGLDLAPDTMYREIKASSDRRYVVGGSVRLAA